MSAILFTQLDTLEMAAGAITAEALADQAELEDVAGELEAQIDVGIGLFQAVQQEALRSGRKAMTEETALDQARHLETMYRRYARIFAHFSGLADRLQRLGRTIEGRDRLQRVHTEISGMLSVSIDRLARSVRELESGQARPLGEVMDELRRRHHS